MKLLITGACGFVGSTLTQSLLDLDSSLEILGLDNFIRPGSETNREALKRRGVKLFHGDLRMPSDFDAVGKIDFVIDAAANPSVLAGVDGQSSSRQLLEHNLGGTLNLLEFCKARSAGFILLSTSRVYSIPPLADLPVEVVDQAFRPVWPKVVRRDGLSAAGLAENFTTAAPVSLYGATKLASETMALEYGATFSLPVFINRCGVLAGGGQFGRPDQGIFSYWINSYIRKAPLRYIGFQGEGFQVRDCLHPRDLAPLLRQQLQAPAMISADRVINCSGGADSAISLRQLSNWCEENFGGHLVNSDPTPRPFDIPWMVLDSARAKQIWNWTPLIPRERILQEIADHARKNPNWLEVSAPL